MFYFIPLILLMLCPKQYIQQKVRGNNYILKHNNETDLFWKNDIFLFISRFWILGHEEKFQHVRSKGVC